MFSKPRTTCSNHRLFETSYKRQKVKKRCGSTLDHLGKNDVRYIGTPGLYELIFKRIPDDELYTRGDDLEKYKSILLVTNAHRRDYDAQGHLKVQHTNPVTYLLEDYRKKSIAGAFYEHELHHANYPDVYLMEKVLRRRGDEVYVKWLGFDSSHNSWVHKDHVI
ncbi:uncharacterized protein [Anoplolepis gracilipes]|uniref:uncharacterized protein n=1 Tax=Anoplolepis gracilipes TaxID=354296 RepID=UPI003B9FC4CA